MGPRRRASRKKLAATPSLVFVIALFLLTEALQAHTLSTLRFKNANEHSSKKNESFSKWVSTSTSNRSLSVVENCSAHSIKDFPEDLFSKDQRMNGTVLLHVFCGLYSFLLTAYVCNDYLLPSLDCICVDLRISADVAGATFLATASCFPELFVNVVGTFLTESDLGVGTVVGGAVFNTFATPAVGAIFAAKGIQLQWYILSRDCVIYSFSVGVLVIIMWDGLVTWYESVILLLLFASYFSLLFVNNSIIQLFKKIISTLQIKISDVNSKQAEAVKHENYTMPFGTYKPYFHGELVAEYKNTISKIKAQCKNEIGVYPAPVLEMYVEPDTIFRWPTETNLYEKFWFLFTWPLKFLLFVTIPDSRYKRLRRFYPLTFIMCVIWIAISSYLVSWMTTIVGDTIGIPDSVMGITFLSAGGNLPEMVSIVILSRQGHGDMAMSNIFGSNTLDILLCLSLPWAIKSFVTERDVSIVSGTLVYSNLSIILCVVGFYIITSLYGFVLNKRVGILCLIMYALFLIVAIMMELNVFFPVNLPMC